MRKNVNKMISALLILALVLQILPSAFTSHASEITTGTTYTNADTDIKYVYYEEISQYRTGEYSYPEKDGYVFAGWWTGITETEYEKNAEAFSADAGVNGAWAKYIPEEMLTVKAQVSEKVSDVIKADGTVQPNNQKDGIKLRLATGIDDPNKYDEIGFRIKVNNDKNYSTKKFFEELTENEDASSRTVYPNQIFHSAAKHFATYVISGFDTLEEINEKELSVTPYWITKDGTTVYGTERKRLLVSDARAVDSDGTSGFMAPEGTETQTGTYTYTATGTSETTSYKYFKGASDTVYLKGQYTPSSDKNVKFGIAIRNGGETRQVLFSNVGVLITNGDVTTSGLVSGDANAYENVTGTDGVYVWTGRKTSSVTSSGIKNLINATSAKTVIWAIENNVLYCSIEGETVLRLPMEKLCARWQDGRYYQLGVAANGGASESSMTYTLSEDLSFGKNAYGSDKLIAEATKNMTLSNMVYEPIHGSYKASSTNSDTAVAFGSATQDSQVMSAKLQLPTSSSTVDSFNGFYIRSGAVSAQILICYQNGSPILVANSAYPNDFGRVQNWFTSAGVTEFYKNGVCELTAAVKDDTLYIFVNGKLAGSVELYKLLSKSSSNDLYIEGKSSVQLGVVTRKPDVGTISFRDFSVKTGDEADNVIASLGVNDSYEWEIFTDGGDKLFTANQLANHDGYNHTATSSTTDGQNNAIYGVATKMPQKVTATYSFGETEGDITSGNGIIVRGNNNAYTYIYGINGYGQVFRRATGFNWRNGDTNSLIKTWNISGQAYNDDRTYDITAVFKDGWVYVKYNDQVMFKDQIPDWKESHSVRIGLYTCAQASVPTYYTKIKFEAGADIDAESSQIVTNLSNMTYDKESQTFTPGNVSGLTYAYGNANVGSQVMSTTIQLPTSGSVNTANGIYIQSGDVAARFLVYNTGSQVVIGNSNTNDSWYRIKDWVTNAGITEFFKDGECELTAAVQDDILYIFVNDKLAGSVELYKLLSFMAGNDFYIEGESPVALGFCALDPKAVGVSFANYSIKTGEEADEVIETLLTDVTNRHEWEIFTSGNNIMTASNMGAFDGYNHTATSSTTGNANSGIYGIATTMPQKVTATYSFGNTESTVTSGNGIIVRGNNNAYTYIYGINGYDQVFRRAKGFTWQNADTDATNIKTEIFEGQAYNADGTYNITAVVKDGWVYVKYNDQVMFKDQIPDWQPGHSIMIGLFTRTQANVPTYYTNINFEAGPEVKVPSNENVIEEGMNISILGDSISSYAGVSNGVAADTSNSTIKDNAVYYPNSHSSAIAQNETYWGRIIAKYGMNLLVNNSASGSRVMDDVDASRPAGIKRCIELHDNTGDNAGTKPNIIAVYMGTNDLTQKKTVGDLTEDTYTTVKDTDGNYITPTTFTEGYIIMLDKIQATYGETADVFCFTLLPSDYNTDTLLNQYNARIRTIAAHYGFAVVDIAAGSGITRANNGKYMDGSHPHANGHALLADTFEEALMLKYTTFKTFSN